jgi:hypothetical protein
MAVYLPRHTRKSLFLSTLEPEHTKAIGENHHCQNDSARNIGQGNLKKRGSVVPVQERAAIQRFFYGRLGDGNIPDSQNRETTGSRNTRKEKEGGQKF